MDVEDLAALDAAFRNQIIPLLQEYFYDDGQKIQMVLGDLVEEESGQGASKAHPDAILTHADESASSTLGLHDESLTERRSYAIAESLTANSFRKIYGS